MNPYDMSPDDTSAFMAGTCYVQVVLLESDGTIDANLENWSIDQIAAVKTQISLGCDWWETMWEQRGYVGDLQFTLDFTHADNPFSTGYEPIARSSHDESLWINEYLIAQGYSLGAGPYAYLDTAHVYADDLRQANDTDWAFTMFVANSFNDVDGMFTDGDFAYSYINGPFLHMTYDNQSWGIDDMAMITAHEIGHTFGALDEYSGPGSYDERSGYYNIQNLNGADDRPWSAGPRVDSLMAEASLMTNAFDNGTSSPSSLEMIGWRDSDGDGIIDVLDQPILGTGAQSFFNDETRQLTCSGTFEPDVLTRSSVGNSLTINTVDHLQYRFAQGAWQDYNAQAWKLGELNLHIVLDVPLGVTQVEWRLIDADLTAISPVYSVTVPDGDVTAPVLSGLPIVAATGRQATISWLPAVDNLGVTGYELDFDAAVLAVDTDHWTFTDLSVGVHGYRLRARDEAGNWSPWSAEQTFLVTDSTVPVLGGDPVAQINGNQVTISWPAAGDDLGVTGYVLRFAGVEYAVGLALSWQQEDLLPGYYEYAMRAVDADGHDSGWSPTQHIALTTYRSEELTVALAGSANFRLGQVSLLPGSYAFAGEFAAGLNATITLVDRQTGKTVGKTTVKKGVLQPLKNSLLLQGDYELFIASSDRGATGGPVTLVVEGEVFIHANQALDDDPSSAPAMGYSGQTPAVQEWVGFGDAFDYRRLDLTASGQYDIVLSGLENPAKMTVYQINPQSGALKSLKNVSVTPKTDRQGNLANSGGIYGLLLDAGQQYVVMVQATKATKGLNTPYELTLGGTVFDHLDAWNGDDDWTAPQLPTLAVVPGETLSNGWVGYGDAVDFRRLALDVSGRYDFTVDGLANPVQLTIYRLDPVKGTLKALKKVAVTPKFDRSGNWLDSGTIAGLLLDSNETYYLDVQATKAAKGISSPYALTVAGTQFNHPDSTLTDNVWQDPALPILVAPNGAIVDGWVGYGDAIDFRQLQLDYSGLYDFSLSGLTDGVKLTVNLFNAEKGTLKALKSLALAPKTDRAGNLLNTAGSINGLLLDSTQTYYLSVEAPKAASGNFTGYQVQLSGTEFSQDINPDDNAWNGSAVAWIQPGADNGIAAGWVGFGDPVDVVRFNVADEQAGNWIVDLNLEVDKAANLTVYRIVNDKLIKVKLRGEVADLSAGDYAVEIKSGDNGKGKKNTAYDLAVYAPVGFAPAPAPDQLPNSWLA